jgi:hypothetical protein
MRLLEKLKEIKRRKEKDIKTLNVRIEAIEKSDKQKASAIKKLEKLRESMKLEKQDFALKICKLKSPQDYQHFINGVYNINKINKLLDKITKLK